jgi:hypothetical protein
MESEGKGPNQALYDAMRLIIADHYTQLGIEAIQAASAQTYGADYGLGLSLGKKIGCGITGGVTAIGGAVVGLYTGGAGATPVAAGGSMVANTMGCNKDQQRAAQALAETQARQAQSMVDAAEAQARMEAQAQAHERTLATEKTSRFKVGAAVGGGVALLLGLGYMIVRA